MGDQLEHQVWVEWEVQVELSQVLLLQQEVQEELVLLEDWLELVEKQIDAEIGPNPVVPSGSTAQEVRIKALNTLADNWEKQREKGDNDKMSPLNPYKLRMNLIAKTGSLKDNMVAQYVLEQEKLGTDDKRSVLAR